MARRVCAEPGCPELTDTTRCPTHTRAKDKARGTTSARGYGPAHQRERATWQRRIDRGEVVMCSRCDSPIQGAWHLDHTADRLGYLGPSHDLCNLRAAGRISPRD